MEINIIDIVNYNQQDAWTIIKIIILHLYEFE